MDIFAGGEFIEGKFRTVWHSQMIARLNMQNDESRFLTAKADSE